MIYNTLWCIILLVTCEGFASRRSNPKLLNVDSSKRWNKEVICWLSPSHLILPIR
uniref:Secreted protein n=1 Tax=Ascaris lumbricoides TaxID=6252 RepID=A0A0M3IV15_ASCLU